MAGLANDSSFSSGVTAVMGVLMDTWIASVMMACNILACPNKCHKFLWSFRCCIEGPRNWAMYFHLNLYASTHPNFTSHVADASGCWFLCVCCIRLEGSTHEPCMQLTAQLSQWFANELFQCLDYTLNTFNLCKRASPLILNVSPV